MTPFLGNAQILKLKEVGESYLELELSRPKNFNYKAGQYTKLYFPDAPEQPIYLSIASGPKQPNIDLCIMVRDPVMKQKYLDAYKSKTLLRLDLPDGKFLLPEERKQDYVFLAGGSGVSPVRSMLMDVLPDSASSVFLIGARTEEDIPYFAEMTDLQTAHPHFKYYHCSELGEGEHFRGHVIALFEKYVHQFSKDALYFLCGPKPMLDAFVETAKKYGIEETNIFWERY